MGRTAIAEQITELLPDWRHLSLEVLQNALPEDSTDMEEEQMLMIQQCALELQKDGLHLMLSMPASRPHVEMLRDSLAPYCMAVHIGEGDEEGYDLAFDSSVSSVKDIVTFLRHFIERLPEAS